MIQADGALNTRSPIVLVILVIVSMFLHRLPFAEQGNEFSGVEIRVGVMDHSAIGWPAKVHAATWEKKTGGKATIVEFPFGDLFDTYYADLTTQAGGFDVITFASAWMGDFSPYLTVLPEYITQSESFDDIHKVYRERLMKWGDEWLAITLDGDLYSGYYRQDLFQDKKNQQDFRDRYGYQLAPPNTWSQYRDIAEFFTGRTDADGRRLYGTTESFARGGLQFWTLFSRASAYANHPDRKGAQFFDPHTMQAQINNAAWVRAVNDYKDIVQFTPPGSLGFGIEEARVPFMRGETAMILDWGDTAQQAGNPEISDVSGKVGFFVLPGTHEVWDYVDKEWDAMSKPYKAPFLAFGGWIGGVVKTSKHKEAAFDYLMWYSSPENSLRDVVTSGTGINPYRYTHFSNIDAWTKALTPSAASEYLGMLKASLDSPNIALDLRLPAFYEYTEALEIELENVLHGKVDTKIAMDKVAKEWERITEDRGRFRQRKLYRSSMNLPKIEAKDKSRFTIGLSQTNLSPWRFMLNEEARAEAEKYSSVDLIITDGENDLEKQIRDALELITRKVDLLILCPKISDGFDEVLRAAAEQDIPVIIVDRHLSNDNFTQVISSDNKELGRAAGSYAIDLLGGKGKAQGVIVEIKGDMESTPAQGRSEGFLEAVADESGIKFVEGLPEAQWEQSTAYDIMVSALERNGDIRLVYAHNDAMAFAAYQAAKDAGRDNEIAFLGIDGIPQEGVKWVSEGILDATFLNEVPGDEAVQQAIRILNHAPYAERITLPTMTIDKSNAHAILKSHGIVE